MLTALHAKAAAKNTQQCFTRLGVLASSFTTHSHQTHPQLSVIKRIFQQQNLI